MALFSQVGYYSSNASCRRRMVRLSFSWKCFSCLEIHQTQDRWTSYFDQFVRIMAGHLLVFLCDSFPLTSVYQRHTSNSSWNFQRSPGWARSPSPDRSCNFQFASPNFAASECRYSKWELSRQQSYSSKPWGSLLDIESHDSFGCTSIWLSDFSGADYLAVDLGHCSCYTIAWTTASCCSNATTFEVCAPAPTNSVCRYSAELLRQVGYQAASNAQTQIIFRRMKIILLKILRSPCLIIFYIVFDQNKSIKNVYI